MNNVENIISTFKNLTIANKEYFDAVVKIFNEAFGEDNVDSNFNIPLTFFDTLPSSKIFLDLLKRTYANYYQSNQKHGNEWRSITSAYIDYITLEDINKLETLEIKYIKKLYDSFINDHYDSPTITVYFKEKIVKNETDRCHKIRDVYYKLTFDSNIHIKSTSLLRSTYTDDEINSGYMFSHAPILQKVPYALANWKNLCYGKGPIVRTIASLSKSKDLDLFSLFCIELENYLGVESIEGGPYVKLSGIGNNRNLRKTIPTSLTSYTRKNEEIAKIVKDFIVYYISNNDIKYTYSNGIYSIASSELDFYLKVSNSFIDWWNKTNHSKSLMKLLKDYFVLREDVKIDFLKNLVYTEEILNNMPTTEYNDWPMLKFKGKTIYSKVIETEKTRSNTYTLLNQEIVNYIKNLLLNCLNIYGNNTNFDDKKFIS